MRIVALGVAAALLLVMGVARADGSEPECVTVEGKTTCGFQCVVAYGQARCAATPQGVCGSGYGRVACWDPPPYVVRHYGDDLPQAGCLADAGDLACGYGCITAYDHVRCTETPVGACGAWSGTIACSDPWPGEFRRERGDLPAMTCLESSDRIGCGYGCAYGFGEVRCSRSPEGFCQVAPERLVCVEPPPPAPP
jgi:hypothetical protein